MTPDDDGIPNEDIYFVISPHDDGLVRMGVFLAGNHEKIFAAKFFPEVARTVAQNLTLASWKAEDGTKGKP